MSSDVQGDKHEDSNEKPDETRLIVIRQFVLEQFVDDGSGQQCYKKIRDGRVVLEVEDVTSPADV